MVALQIAPRDHSDPRAGSYAGKGALASTHLDPSCVSADFTVTTVSFYQTFDMSHYPFEVHELRFELVSFFSTAFVALKLTQSIASGAIPRPRGVRSGRGTSPPRRRGSAALVEVGKINYDWFFHDRLAFYDFVRTGCQSRGRIPPPAAQFDGRLSICYCVYTPRSAGTRPLWATRDRTVQPTALSAFTRNKMDAKAQVVHPETTRDGKPAI